jgi:CBS domain-containing protein
MSEERAGEDVRILRVDETMRKDPVVVDGRATIAEAIAVMKRTKSLCVVIKPRWDGDAYGLLTARDVAVKAVGAGPKRLNFSEHQVAEIMDKPAIAAAAELEVKHAVRLMNRSGASGLLVLRDGAPAGTLTLEDVFAAI